MTNQSNSQGIYGSNQLTNFRAVTLRDLMHMSVEGQEWLVDQLIPLNGITCVAGRPKVGKSFVILALAASIASGQPLFGQFEVSQKRVLLISKEDGILTLRNRLEKLRVEYDLNISFCTDQNVFFDDEALLPRIMNLIRECNVQVVIVDSFIRAFRGDENASRAISQVHRVFKMLNDAGVTVIFIHHHGKEDAQRPRGGGDSLRGSSDIYAMIDSLLTIKASSDHALVLSNDANRHAERTLPFNISFPDFREDNRSFQFLGYVDGAVLRPAISQIDKASEDILELLGRSTPMHQNDIVRHLIDRDNPGYSQTTVKSALARFERAHGLTVTLQQNRKFYSLTVSEPLNEAQTIEEMEA